MESINLLSPIARIALQKRNLAETEYTDTTAISLLSVQSHLPLIISSGTFYIHLIFPSFIIVLLVLLFDKYFGQSTTIQRETSCLQMFLVLQMSISN